MQGILKTTSLKTNCNLVSATTNWTPYHPVFVTASHLLFLDVIIRHINFSLL